MAEFLPRPSFSAADSFEGAREGTEGSKSWMFRFRVMRMIFWGMDMYGWS